MQLFKKITFRASKAFYNLVLSFFILSKKSPIMTLLISLVRTEFLTKLKSLETKSSLTWESLKEWEPWKWAVMSSTKTRWSEDFAICMTDNKLLLRVWTQSLPLRIHLLVHTESIVKPTRGVFQSTRSSLKC